MTTTTNAAVARRVLRAARALETCYGRPATDVATLAYGEFSCIGLTQSLRIGGVFPNLERRIVLDKRGAALCPTGSKGQLEYSQADGATTLASGGVVQPVPVSTVSTENMPCAPVLGDVKFTHYWSNVDDLRSVMLAAAEDETRWQMHSVCFATYDGNLTAVATNGKTMAVAQRVVRQGGGLRESIVPLPAVKAAILASEVDKSDPCRDTILLRFSDSHVEISGEGWSVIAQLVEGNFPDWRRVLPNKIGSTITLLEPNSVQKVCDTWGKALRHSEQNTMTICASDLYAPGLGARAELATATGDYCPEINLSPTYIAKALKYAGDTVRMCVIDRKTAVRLDVSATLRWIVMPLVSQE